VRLSHSQTNKQLHVEHRCMRTSDLKTSVTSTTSVVLRLGDGFFLEKSKESRQKAATIGMYFSQSTNKKRPRESATAIVESAPPSRKKISSGKNQCFKRVIPTTQSSQTSGQASITRENSTCSWWTRSCQEQSRRLSSRIVTDSPDSVLNSSNGYVNVLQPNSWCSISRNIPQNGSFQRISYPSSMFSAADIMACDDTKRSKPKGKKQPKQMLAQKIRLKPTVLQARKLRQWVSCARETYNRALNLVKTKKQKPTRLLKKLVVNTRQGDRGKISTMKNCPAAIRERAVLDLVDAHTSAWALYKSKKKKKRYKPGKLPFNIKFKSKRLVTDSIGFEAKSMKTEGTTIHLFAGSKQKKHQKLALKNLKMSEQIQVMFIAYQIAT
jgi:hypothetical protein